MKFILNNQVNLLGLKSQTADIIKQHLTLLNPKYEEARKMGRYSGNIPEKLTFFNNIENGLQCPRGFSDQAYRICRQNEDRIKVEDNRRVLPPVDFNFTGTLRDYQDTAVSAMIPHTHGTLFAPTGSGKTVMALAIIARHSQPTLIVVHTRELLNQWLGAIEHFLGITDVGILGAGKFKPGNIISVGLVQTLKNKYAAITKKVGHVIVDECHKCPARTFTDVITQFDAKFFTGLSATPWRRDKLTLSIYFHLGEQRHQVPREQLFQQGNLIKPRVIPRETVFETPTDPGRYYSIMMKELCRDPERNRLICRDISLDDNKGIKLILSDRREHCHELARILDADYGLASMVLTGSTPAGKREEIVSSLKECSSAILISTIALLSEGFDLPRLSTLFLTTPIRFSGRLMQCLGRILRPAPGKNKATVYDYVDTRVGVLCNAAAAREQIYMDLFGTGFTYPPQLSSGE
ncbi:Superfamily II DNA or RNA helicase [Desulfocicer vacuolatum DSM 3385]|uniref:Superfamily II DNA or RNA helicase n=1 Tax=Desulfocicer vacuolatum DSM 3385 TaxID=1121400 RepID=A0A1W2AI71_9BACT|nr:DEAD/DEAH box helicase [Desulfocicer vacuolatum]SMC60324.1 Superfamily II DNA or RNA helicase [Desulfocicer vacuolatum DSM 3385]